MAKQRRSLVEMQRIAAEARAAEAPEAVRSEDTAPYGAEKVRRLVGDVRKAEPPAAIELGDMTTTAVHIPRATLALLRRVAVERANRKGGRPSVSAVLVELVEGQRTALEAELDGAR